MMELRQCPDCGAYLDPGEICDCQFFGDEKTGGCAGCINKHNCGSCRFGTPEEGGC